MSGNITCREAAKIANRSVTWLRTHTCGWCDASCMTALRYGCQSMYAPQCEPAKKSYGPEMELSST